MEVLKKVGKVFLFLITILLSIILIIDITVYNIRDITKIFISEEKIKEELSTINILDLLKDQNGNEIKEITKIKNTLVDAGIPVQTVESFINSEPIHNIAEGVMNETVNYIFYGKEPTISNDLNEESIINFLDTNMSIIAKELQDKNVPKSELLTEELQEEILINIENKIPIIEENLNNISNQLMNKIENTDEFKQIQDYQKKLEKGLSIIQFIYSDKLTNIIIIIFVVCIIGIILSRFNPYSYLKYLGIVSIIVSSLLFSINLLIPKLFTYINQVPYVFQNFVKLILNDSKELFLNKSIFYLIIGIILILLNIIIFYIREKLEDRKINKGF